MTFTLDSVSFEAEGVPDEENQAVAKHEVAGSDTPWTQLLGKNSPDVEINAILETADKDALDALDRTAVHAFSDSVTGLSNVSVWIQRFAVRQLAPGIWSVGMTLVRRGN